jgi:hypothetical protein
VGEKLGEKTIQPYFMGLMEIIASQLYLDNEKFLTLPNRHLHKPCKDNSTFVAKYLIPSPKRGGCHPGIALKTDI